MPAAPALPALGVKFFRELLTPRLSEEELSRRVCKTVARVKAHARGLREGLDI
jgi:hypothetical protein